MKITPNVALEVASHEALIRQAYKDGVGVWTWSVGLTSATGHDVERYIDNPQPLRHCLDIWLWALENYAETVRRVFHGFPLTEAQFAAALSFHWNTGAIRNASWVDAFKAGNMADAERRLGLWTKSGGRDTPGLVLRRKREANLFFRGHWHNRGHITEYTRVTKRHTPDWSSGSQLYIEPQLRELLEGTPVDPSHPDPVDQTLPEAYNSVWARLWAWLKSLFS